MCVCACVRTCASARVCTYEYKCVEMVVMYFHVK